MYDLNSSHIVLRERGEEIRLRRSLFWDLPEKGLDLKRNRRLILERVFSRGNLNEFKQINRFYSRDEIRRTVIQIGSLDKKTLNFISRAYQLNPTKFKCYRKNQ